MMEFFNHIIKPRNDELKKMLVTDRVRRDRQITELTGEELVNLPMNYTKDGITHVHVMDDNAEWKLEDGTWHELPPF